jgi:hypothetical protein
MIDWNPNAHSTDLLNKFPSSENLYLNIYEHTKFRVSNSSTFKNILMISLSLCTAWKQMMEQEQTMFRTLQ